jgi:YebC/PmpR family DNA-binding regulatory protein
MTNEQDKRFETLRREIVVAAREQGPDPDQNFRLRDAIRRSNASNMPDETIEDARIEGANEDTELREVTFEGYGPDGVAVLVQTITDDRGRTATALEELFEAHGGNLGEDGCVSWQFERRGIVRVHAGGVRDSDAFMLEVIEMGAEQLRQPVFNDPTDGRTPTYRVYCDPTDVRELDRRLQDAGYPVYSAATQYDATQRVELTPDRARNFLDFFEKLTIHPDVANAYANWSVA